MKRKKLRLLPGIESFLESLPNDSIASNRLEILEPLIDYSREKLANHQDINLNFICTHNSRRSQFAQVWAQTAAAYLGLPVYGYSGGVEVAAVDLRAVQALERVGFKVTSVGNHNPVHHIYFSWDADPIHAFSKLYNNTTNPQKYFAAVMVCSDADENCPFIPGAEKRIALNYHDPKEFDGTPREAEKYDERCRQIASEIFYVLQKIRS